MKILKTKKKFFGNLDAPLFTEEELNELAEMFPSIEREVIKQVLEAKGGVKEAAVTALLDISG